MNTFPSLIAQNFVELSIKRPGLREIAAQPGNVPTQANGNYEMRFFGAGMNQSNGPHTDLIVVSGKYTLSGASNSEALCVDAFCVGEFYFAIAEPLTDAFARDAALMPYLFATTEPAVRVYLQQTLLAFGMNVVLPTPKAPTEAVRSFDVPTGAAAPFSGSQLPTVKG